MRKRDTSSCQTSVSLIQHACNVWPLPTRAAILLDRVDIGSRLVATAYVQRATNNETVEAARLQLVCGAVPVCTRPSAAPTTITLLLRLYRCVLSRQSSALREPRGWLKRRYAEGLRFTQTTNQNAGKEFQCCAFFTLFLKLVHVCSGPFSALCFTFLTKSST